MTDKATLLQFVQATDWNSHLNDPVVVNHVAAIKSHVGGGSAPTLAAATGGSTSSSGSEKRVKCVVVGDGAVGKTSLLIRYSSGTFPTDYLPTVFDNHTAHMNRNGEKITLHLWDTAGQEDYDRLRPLSYPGADVILLCFSTVNQSSYDAIREKWAPEVQHYIPNIPHILIGTKIDLREEKTPDPNSGLFEPLTAENGAAMAKEIGATKYMEICSKNGQGIEEVFNEAVDQALRDRAAAEGSAVASGGAAAAASP
ncbi:Rho GTPase, partial [Planoprotostelium fungivorum]